MFNKTKFAQVLKELQSQYENQGEFSKKSGMGRTYLSSYINLKINQPPKPAILKDLSEASKGLITYDDLMQICGYSDNLEKSVYDIYIVVKNLIKKFDTLDYVYEDIAYFLNYISDLAKNLESQNNDKLLFTNYFMEKNMMEDFYIEMTFLTLYDFLLKCLERKEYIIINKYEFCEWTSLDIFYEKSSMLPSLELLDYTNKDFVIKIEQKKEIINYIKEFVNALNLSYLSDFEPNELAELFKKKALGDSDKADEDVEKKSEYIELYESLNETHQTDAIKYMQFLKSQE